MYVGRNQLDAATLDRFVLATIHVKYDEALERRIAGLIADEDDREKLLTWVWELREKISKNRLRRVASTRLIVGGVKMMVRGKSLSDVKARFFQDWTTDEMAKAA